ncbi:hypothetical protein NEFER03_0374 [Nematocida sp. LUAm3]|nr:hypothetical protein NEFER03_0374 [Nematocida sp. LUAm3]KAI5176010.1 hypothetical protein NEFER02_1856 [Nematocida sp. LUAm2]KAI5179107.1 hypothetical protein NEFER01_1974 [Nematocida sp. LUAm1]
MNIRFYHRTDSIIPCRLKLSLLITLYLLLASVTAVVKPFSKNSNAKKTVKIFPYSEIDFKNIDKSYLERFQRSYLEGFRPFTEINKDLQKLSEMKTTDLLQMTHKKQEIQSKILQSHYSTNYFLTLRNAWKSEQDLYIYDQQIDNFTTMLRMANEPFYAMEDNLYLDLPDLYEILSLYVVFNMSASEKIPVSQKAATGVDMFKRSVFKENMRIAIQHNEEAERAYQGILSHIRKINFKSNTYTITLSYLNTEDWNAWALSQDEHRDLFWYLYSSICNEEGSITTGNKTTPNVVAYVKENFILGRKGISLRIGSAPSDPKYEISISEYLVYKNPAFLHTLEVDVEEGLNVPPMQLSALIELFPFIRLIFIKSLGNGCLIKQNLEIVSIILDLEKRRQEAHIAPTLRGLVIEDYNSLTGDAKERLLTLPMLRLGYFKEADRRKCCYDTGHACVFPLENSPANFFGKFSIADSRASSIRGLTVPLNVVFEEDTIKKLPNLEELIIYIEPTELSEEMENSSLPEYLLEKRSLRIVRLIGGSFGFESSYLSMFKKILQIKYITEIDITKCPIREREMLAEIVSGTNALNTHLKKFLFSYVEPENSVANTYNIYGGTPSLFENIMEGFPNLTHLGFEIDPNTGVTYNVVRDFKYLLRCNNGIDPEKIKKILKLRVLVPLKETIQEDCNGVVDHMFYDIRNITYSIFNYIDTCPKGPNSHRLRDYTINEYQVDLHDVFKESLCPGSSTCS